LRCSKASAFGPFIQPGSPAQTLIPENGVLDRLQSANHILLTERVINKDNHLTTTEYVFIPTSQTGHPSVPGFGLLKKAFVIVIGPWNMRMVIACKQAFPKPSCIVHEIGHERFVVFVGISCLTIAKKAIEWHEGVLTLESSPGKTLFRIRLAKRFAGKT